MGEQTNRLVTPEAVVLELETAGLGSRLPAALIDLAIQGVLLVVASVALLGIGDATSATAGVVVLLLVFSAVLLGYPIAFETLWRGRTPGKAALGLRVVTTDGAPVRFRHAAVRGFLTLVDFYLTSGAGAVLSVLFTRDNQRLGDLAAGTLVLRQRSGAEAPRPVEFRVPPGHEAYAATLDLARLTAADALAVRSFLLRSGGLPTQTRGPLAVQLATTVAGRIAHSPPGGTDPEMFLVCVAAVHQSRSRSPMTVPTPGAPAPARVPSPPAAAPGPPSEGGLAPPA
ncbi:MAG: RDD family protein [Acidimicrobiales bacterium]